MNISKKNPTAITILLLLFPVTSGASLCEIVPPVETAQQAECAAEHFLIIQSCLSKYGFTRRVSQTAEYWEVIVEDNNPDKNKACRGAKLRVCKTSGMVINAESNEKCPT